MYLFLIIIIILIIFFYLKKKSSFNNGNKIGKIGIISLMYKPKNVETWLQIHRDLGISHFYIRLENTPELIDYLKSQPDITLMVADSSSDKNQYLTLQNRQSDTVNKVLKMCKNDNIDWLIHIDCDEILEGDINEILNLPDSVGTFWMQNHEAVYNSIPTSTDNCFQAKYYKNCGDPTSKCISYINGKGGGRTSISSCNGPHRFKGGEEIKLKNMIVKHYESCDFEQYIKKYQRLSKGVNLDIIPFPYYRESILAKDNIDELKDVYKRYRVA